MQIINRNEFNDSMFEEMANFAQHVIKPTPYRNTVELLKDGAVIATLEDARIVFNKPDTVQLKARIGTSVLSKILKTDTISVVISAIESNKEPTTTIKVTGWFEELKDIVDAVPEIHITPNRWIYLKGTK